MEVPQDMETAARISCRCSGREALGTQSSTDEDIKALGNELQMHSLPSLTTSSAVQPDLNKLLRVSLGLGASTAVSDHMRKFPRCKNIAHLLSVTDTHQTRIIQCGLSWRSLSEHFLSLEIFAMRGRVFCRLSHTHPAGLQTTARSWYS